jgi:AsmA protein
MPNLRRPHILIPAAIAILAVAAVAVLWVGARTELARGMAARMIMERTGLPATVESLRLGFLPTPSIGIGGLTLAQPPGYGTEPLLSVGRLRLELPWGSLFSRDRLDAAEVSNATLRLVVGDDGVPNWTKIGVATTEAPAAPAEAAPADGAAAPAHWFLGDLAVDHGVIDYRDEAAGTQWQLAAIAAKAQGLAPGAQFPLELSLGGVFGENTFHYAVKGLAKLDTAAGRHEATGLAYRGWLGGEPLPLAGAELTGTLARVAYESASGRVTLDAGRLTFGGVPAAFDGHVDFGGAEPAGEVKLVTEPFAPRPSAVAFGFPLPATADPAAFESLQAAATAKLADGALMLDPVSGRLDDTNFEGSAMPGQRRVRLSLDRIDFDRYLPPAAAADKPAQAAPRSTPAAPASSKKQTLEEIAAGLSTLELDLELRIGEATVAGARMRDVAIRVLPEEPPAP